MPIVYTHHNNDNNKMMISCILIQIRHMIMFTVSFTMIVVIPISQPCSQSLPMIRCSLLVLWWLSWLSAPALQPITQTRRWHTCHVWLIHRSITRDIYHMCVCIYIYIYLFMYIYIYIYAHTHIYMHIYIYMYMHMHIYTYIYIHTYTYTHVIGGLRYPSHAANHCRRRLGLHTIHDIV